MIGCSTTDNVAVITLDRPPVNALSVHMVEELATIIGTIRDSDDVHAVVVAGNGEHFSAGMDIRELEKDIATDPALAIPAAKRFDEVFQQLADLKQPVISAVDGYALGGACMLTLYCDIRFGSEGSFFGLPEIGLGGLPSFGLQRLVRAIGVSQAQRLVLSGDRIYADEALRIGLIDVLTPSSPCLPEALALGKRIASHAVMSVQLCKEAIEMDATLPLAVAGRLNLTYAERVAGTADRHEALLAYLEKRPPVLVGR